MTKEEAIEFLKNMIDREVIAICQFHIEALQMAISALEKQIPKNPIVNGDRTKAWSKKALICPACNQFFGSVYNEGYCNRCGQKLIQKRIKAIDWMEGER